MSYFRQTEKLKISYKKVNIDRKKSCKPVIYNTLENFSLRLSQENMMILSAMEKWDGIKNIFTQPEKYNALKKYLLNSLPGSLDEKINFIKNFDPSEKEDKIRSGYLFIPSQIKIDTPSRFFTYSLLYTSRRYKISSQKPQLFTPSEFSLESRGFEHLKHEYLIFKLINKYLADDKKVSISIDTLKTCEHCKSNSNAVTDCKNYLEMFSKREFQDFNPVLPFVDYTTAQIRGKNVWYSSSDFKIYTLFGTIESYTVEGEVWTKWNTSDSDYLQALWGIYRIFCQSRGIKHETPVFQDTGLKEAKIAFTDFDTPYIPNTYSKGMVLPHSRITVSDTLMPRIHRRGKKFMLNDRVVDFEIYAVYDISQQLYTSHKLEPIKNMIYTLDIEVSKDELMSNFDNSKLYKIVTQDQIHYSSRSDKYLRTGMLGAPGSFTRALTIADENKITRYRSSFNPKFISKRAIEFDTVEGVPILDMFAKINYTRMRSQDKISFDKVLSGKSLTANDKQNLISLKNKMGLEALGSALVMHKHILRNMIAGNMTEVNLDVLQELLDTVLTVIHDCMDLFPKYNVRLEYPGSPNSFWCVLKTMINLNYSRKELALHLIRGLLRAKK